MYSEERFEAVERQLKLQVEATANVQQALDMLLTRLNDVNTEPRRVETPSNLSERDGRHDSRRESREHSSRLKAAKPDDFDGDRTKGRAFLNSCQLYFAISAQDFANDQSKIHWVLSYMKGDRAATFADRVLRFEARELAPRFETWNEFRETFVETFCPENAATEAIMRLESIKYFQSKRSVDAYIDEFEDLVDVAGYTDNIAIVVKFRRGLDPRIQDKIAESGADRPADNDLVGWVKAARRFDANRIANEAFHAAAPRRVAPTGFSGIFPRNPNPFQRPSNPSSTPAVVSKFQTSNSTSNAGRSLPPGVPMDVDANKSKALPVSCYRCGKPGHISRECPTRFDIRHMTSDEREDWLEGLLAGKDVVVDEETVAAVESNEESHEEDFANRNE